MPIITRLVAGKKNPSRANVYLDGHFALALSIDEVAKQGLKKGKELTEEEVASLIATDNHDRLYSKILNFISFRPRSVKEVRDRLYQYDVKDEIEQNLLIERLTSRGYLDDLKFAKWFIASRNSHKLRSPRELLAELSSKGISREIQGEVLAGVNPPEETILRLLSKKLGSQRALSLPERQKICSYLVQHGFSWDQVKEVVKSWESA